MTLAADGGNGKKPVVRLSTFRNAAKHLQKAGVYAQLEVYPECWHVFQQMPIRRAAVAMESAGRFVQRII